MAGSTAPRLSGREGFTLIELLISMAAIAVIGMALVRLSLAQSHFVHQQDADRVARGVATGALNVLLTELRMVDAEGGVLSASSDSVRLRVPIAFGVICGTAAGATTLSILPTDSATLANSSPSGYAYRSGDTYLYRDTINAVLGDPTVCQADSISTLSGGLVVDVTPVATQGAGTPAFAYQTVLYEFKASTLLPGRTALWRTQVSSGRTEEIATPFDSTSAFRFFVLDADTAQAAPPADLADVRGLEFTLIGESELPAQGESEPTEFNLTATVHFKNRAN